MNLLVADEVVKPSFKILCLFSSFDCEELYILPDPKLSIYSYKDMDTLVLSEQNIYF